METDDEGNRLNYDISRQAAEEVVRGNQTRDAKDLVKIGQIMPSFLDKNTYHPTYAKNVARMSQASANTLLQVGPDHPQLIQHTLGARIVARSFNCQQLVI